MKITATMTTVGVISTSEACRRPMFDNADNDVGLILFNQLTQTTSTVTV